MPGRWVPITWHGQAATAWQPSVLTWPMLEPSASLARRTERAASAAQRADEQLPSSWEPVTRMLLRTEGIASSDIEGLRAPVDEVALALVDEKPLVQRLGGSLTTWWSSSTRLRHHDCG